MSKKRQRRRKVPTPPPPQPSWLRTLRSMLLVEAGLIALALLYIRIVDPFEQGIDAWIATFVMILWSTLALLLAYAASRPARPRSNQVGWVIAGFVGGSVILGFLLSMMLGYGESTSPLGIIVLPVYHWGLIALMLLVLAMREWGRR